MDTGKRSIPNTYNNGGKQANGNQRKGIEKNNKNE